MKKFSMKIKVYYEDTDAGGVMYHASHIRFMERARTDFLYAEGLDIAAYQARGQYFVVSHVDIHYRAPVHLGEVLDVTAEIGEVRRASVTVHQTIMRDGVLVAEADITIVFRDTRGIIRLPDEVLAIARACSK